MMIRHCELDESPELPANLHIINNLFKSSGTGQGLYPDWTNVQLLQRLAPDTLRSRGKSVDGANLKVSGSGQIIVAVIQPIETKNSLSICPKMFIFFALIVLLAMLGGPTSARANDVYIAQSSAGAGNGSSCASAAPVSFFNNSSNWGSGSNQIGPGTTVHLCGVITTGLAVQASGTSGNQITIFFEPGAKLSQPASTSYLLSVANKSFITINGGINGVMENTANGTGLANQASTIAVQASGAHDISVENVTCQNLYVHTLASDNTSLGPDGCYYANGTSGNVIIHDMVMHDVRWAVTITASNGASNFQFFNNEEYNMDHGLAMAEEANGVAISNFSFHDNHIHDFANWDSTGNSYHHDGLHIYMYCPGDTRCSSTTPTGISI